MARLSHLPGFAAAALALSSPRALVAAQKPVTSVQSPQGRNPLTDEFSSFVNDKLDEWKVPGMSVAVIDGQDVYAEGYGYATLPDKRATPETVWECASTTKAQVAATLGQLIASDKYPELSNGWATKISSVIRDDFVLQDDWATNHVTFEDAASHRTGMPRHDKSSAHTVNGTQVTARDVVRNLRHLPMVSEPRVAFHYCNLMYEVLGHVIETVTGKWVGKVMRDILWDPLGMNSTFLESADSQRPEAMATGYYWDKQAQAYKEVAPQPIVEMSAAGGVRSTVLDYAQWVKCLLHEAEPLSASVHKEIKAPRITTTFFGDISLYALGWERRQHKGHVIYTHAGGVTSFGAQVYWLPEEKFGVVAFANTALTSNAVEDVVIYRLIEDRLGISEGDRIDVGVMWRKNIGEYLRVPDNVDQVLFPDRPSPPLPSTFKVEDLVGRYSGPGYGEFTLRQEPHPDKSGEKILVADRDDMTWRYRISMHHASGNYWGVYLTVPSNPTFFLEYLPAEFTTGVDGRVSTLIIDWIVRMEGVDEGKVAFQKIA
ncbi:hypothetical protein CDD83_5481 [Cordyceps sp. RAO-2017]|nr:hypothetical protein CDD83_5481 [Cordyceps sp. RAO-2017]